MLAQVFAEVQAMNPKTYRTGRVLRYPEGEIVTSGDPGNSRRELLLKLKKKDIELIGGM